MNTPIKDRSDEELNRTIAEWMGWKFVPEHDVSFITPAGHAMPEEWTDPEGEPYSIPPNYCRDLNACHEAVGKCNDSQAKYWVFQLDQLLRANLRDQGVPQWPDDFSRYNATSRQRAEALAAVIERQKGDSHGK